MNLSQAFGAIFRMTQETQWWSEALAVRFFFFGWSRHSGSEYPTQTFTARGPAVNLRKDGPYPMAATAVSARNASTVFCSTNPNPFLNWIKP